MTDTSVHPDISPPAVADDARRGLLQAVPSWPYNFSFAFFNLSAYGVLTGPALILMMRAWDASAFQIGLLLSMMPATQVVQLFIAPYIERCGINRFVISGLIFRNVFHTLLFVIPLMAGQWGHFKAMTILLVVMFFADMSHSIGYAGWMTWISWLVPESHRGRYFSIEQLMNTTGQTIVIFASGVILGQTPENYRFSIFFAIGALVGWLSIYALCRIPAPPKLQTPPDAVMFWKWILPLLRIEAFRKLLYVLVCTTMMVMMGNFSVIFMTEHLHIKQNYVLYMGSVGTLGSALSVYFWGKLADQYGSKQIMVWGQRLMLVGSAYWLLIAAGIPYLHIVLLMAAGLITIIGLIAYVVTGFRYVCGHVPREYMVFGTVIFNLTVQLSASTCPVLWGKALDILAPLNITFGFLSITRFTPMYAIMLGWVILANIFAIRLPDDAGNINKMFSV